MHLNDETTGHVPADLTAETDDTDLSDEALDRVPGTGVASIYQTGGFSHPDPALRP
jgi:hypothetical protein